MGYIAIPLVASIILVIHHVAFTDASRWSKVIVASAVVGSLVIWRYFPLWLVFATLLESAASVYMLVCLRIRDGNA